MDTFEIISLIVLTIMLLVLAWGAYTLLKEVVGDFRSNVVEFGFKKPKDIGYPDIKVGDKFEGFACGCFFTNQVAKRVNGEFVEGTTNLAIFSKEYIRPIREHNMPPEFYSIGLTPEQSAKIEQEHNNNSL